MFGHSYVWNTFEILPKTPSMELIVCDKCAIREGGYKNKKQLHEHFDKI